ncbi:unnamed protein product [Oncorhynchus mykiss]|uniref:RIH domain-containing protein n=1 Tax=Oncorhynchus mykiss TaxID=8022 RepID=A0A060Z429_ONCMY|nr:unnamed protein product [Oncorhynchus mykiss]
MSASLCHPCQSLLLTPLSLTLPSMSLHSPLSPASLIKGNRNNCTQFSRNLDWLVSKLERLESSSGILEVLHCILIESPEALNIIQKGHIKSIISLLYKHGRNHKVSSNNT